MLCFVLLEILNFIEKNPHLSCHNHPTPHAQSPPKKVHTYSFSNNPYAVTIARNIYENAELQTPNVSKSKGIIIINDCFCIVTIAYLLGLFHSFGHSQKNAIQYDRCYDKVIEKLVRCNINTNAACFAPWFK